MRHKWRIELKDFKTNRDEAKCVRCGCKRSNYYGMIGYETSGGQMYNKAPDCIDWEVENAKTID